MAGEETTIFVDNLRFVSGPQPETVKIVDKDCKGGYRIINAADFDEKQHTAFVEKPKKDAEGK